MLNKPESNTTYDTTVDLDTADIGSLTTEDIAKLLVACQNAIKEQYPVSGSKDIWSKIHNGGEYGAYRLTINQLIDFCKGVIRQHGDELFNSLLDDLEHTPPQNNMKLILTEEQYNTIKQYSNFK